MKSLCSSDEEHAHLSRLVTLLREKIISGTEAWSAFAAPSNNKIFTRKNKPKTKVTFSAEEQETYKRLREAVQKHLFDRDGRSCSYCRRSVGHYGWAWHIEHVLPKGRYPARTFQLSNLTIGCVHCNLWKAARVDRQVLQNALLIINPVSPGFHYSDHLRYVQLSTESLNFAKYSTHSPLGRRTYELLSFEELERAHAINRLDSISAELHDRITRAMSASASDLAGKDFLKLLGSLKSAIYMRP